MESKDQNGFVTFNEVVAEIQLELNDMTPRNRERYLNLAVSVYKSMNMFELGTITTKKFKPGINGIINLPSDYITYSKVGIDINGHVVTLGYDNTIVLNTTENCGLEYSEALKGCASDTEYETFFGAYGTVPFGAATVGSYIPVFYGATGGLRPGYYRIDEKRRQLHLDPICCRHDVILEYFTTGISYGFVTYIPQQCVPTIVAGTLLKIEMTGGSQGMIEQRKEVYSTEYQRLLISKRPSLYEYYDTILKGYSQLAKR